MQFVSGGLFGHDLGGLDTVVEGKLVTKRGDPMTTAFGRGPREGLRDARGTRPPKDRPEISSGSAYLRSTYEQGRTYAGWNEIRSSIGSFPLDGIGQHLYVDQDGATSAENINVLIPSPRASHSIVNPRKNGTFAMKLL